MSFINLMDDVVFNRDQIADRGEAMVRGMLGVDHDREHILLRRSVSFAFYMFAQILPDGHPAKTLMQGFGRPLSETQLAELMSAAVAFNMAEAEVDEALVDMELKAEAMAYEAAVREFNSLPPVPEIGEEGEAPEVDLHAERRSELLLVMGSLSDAAMELVVARDAARPKVETPAIDGEELES